MNGNPMSGGRRKSVSKKRQTLHKRKEKKRQENDTKQINREFENNTHYFPSFVRLIT